MDNNKNNSNNNTKAEEPTSEPSCLTCLYSKGGTTSCNRHLNKIKPDYSKGVECYYNGYIHYRDYKDYRD